MLGLAKVPVRFLDVSERDAHLLALADNRLGEIAEWDERAVGEILSDVSFSDALIAGWSGDELGKLADAIVGAPDDDASPSLRDGLRYAVIIECANEDEQTMMLERFDTEGLRAKPLVT